MKIALVGSRGSGKDFLADMLIQYKSYQKIAWAEALKEYCNTLYPNLEKYNTHEAKDKPVPEDWNKDNETPRNIWERVSREKAIQDDRFFHKITLKDIGDLLKETNNIIVTDTRNKVEYEKLKHDGYTIIKITRPGKKQFQGYDERIKEFWDDIELEYLNDSDGLDFINQVAFLEKV
jgi:dephospho-CoA kinase